MGVVPLVGLGGGVALAVQADATACERYVVAVERDDFSSFEAQQRAQAEALDACMAEENRSAPSWRLHDQEVVPVTGGAGSPTGRSQRPPAARQTPRSIPNHLAGSWVEASAGCRSLRPSVGNGIYRTTRDVGREPSSKLQRLKAYGDLGSFGVGFLASILLSPVRSEGGGVPDCVGGSECREIPAQCHTLLGWEDVMDPFSCSLWAAFAAAVAIGLAARTVGRLREKVARQRHLHALREQRQGFAYLLLGCCLDMALACGLPRLVEHREQEEAALEQGRLGFGDRAVQSQQVHRVHCPVWLVRSINRDGHVSRQ